MASSKFSILDQEQETMQKDRHPEESVERLV